MISPAMISIEFVNLKKHRSSPLWQYIYNNKQDIEGFPEIIVGEMVAKSPYQLSMGKDVADVDSMSLTFTSSVYLFCDVCTSHVVIV